MGTGNLLGQPDKNADVLSTMDCSRFMLLKLELILTGVNGVFYQYSFQPVVCDVTTINDYLLKANSGGFFSENLDGIVPYKLLIKEQTQIKTIKSYFLASDHF